jgi:hypothetical protein
MPATTMRPHPRWSAPAPGKHNASEVSHANHHQITTKAPPLRLDFDVSRAGDRLRNGMAGRSGLVFL